MRKVNIRFTPTRCVIAMGIVCYLITVNLVALTHEHDHDEFGSEHCSACFIITNHAGVQIHSVDLTSLDASTSIHIPINFIFISAIRDSNVKSRAPPAFSV